MNPLTALFSPVKDLGQAILMPLRAVFVVGLCAAINAMTSPGHWWFKWVALGMGVATVVALAKGLRALLILALVALAGRWLYKRYGTTAKARFDEWAKRTQPQAMQVLQALRDSHQPAPAADTGSGTVR